MDSLEQIKNVLKKYEDSMIFQPPTEFFNLLISTLKSVDLEKPIKTKIEKWADFGWAVSLIEGWADCYDSTPNDITEADTSALKHFNEEDLSKLIEKLKIIVDRENIFDEAVFCYDNEKYTACSSILFSMIDSVFVGQKISNGKGLELTLSCAKKLIQEHEKDKFNRNNLSFYSTLYTIKVYYKFYDKFNDEPTDITNRNFICHGMNKRNVTKIDCIKLFLLTYGTYIIKKEYALPDNL